MPKKCIYNNTCVILQNDYLERESISPNNLEKPTDLITSDSNIQTGLSNICDVENISEHEKTKPRILLVDDEKDIAEVFRSGLSLKGFQVDAFNDPQKLLDNFEACRYDVMITDVRMPCINGLELYEKIKKLDNKIKIYFLSACEIYENETNKVSPNSIIKKPVSIESLANLISS